MKASEARELTKQAKFDHDNPCLVVIYKAIAEEAIKHDSKGFIEFYHGNWLDNDTVKMYNLVEQLKNDGYRVISHEKEVVPTENSKPIIVLNKHWLTIAWK